MMLSQADELYKVRGSAFSFLFNSIVCFFYLENDRFRSNLTDSANGFKHVRNKPMIIHEKNKNLSGLNTAEAVLTD